MRPMNVLMIASLNRGKQDEFEALLAKHKMKMVLPSEYVRNIGALDRVESKSKTASYFDNAHAKCKAAFQAAKIPTFADDSGIEIDALKGEPGVHSAHFGEPKTNLSQEAANRKKVLDLLKGKTGEQRKARMRSVMVFQMEGVLLQAEGVCEGMIAESELGDGGFGYDSIFIPADGGGRRFSEMSQEEKNAISHRAKAVAHLVELIKDRNLQFVRP